MPTKYDWALLTTHHHQLLVSKPMQINLFNFAKIIFSTSKNGVKSYVYNAWINDRQT